MPAEKQDNGKPVSIYLKDRERRMANALIKSGHYASLSELVRYNIERDFNERITDPREQLKQTKENLEQVIKELEELVDSSDDAMNSLIERYLDRKRNLPAKALGDYERFSKNWISKNMMDAEIAFPGKNVDEIYIELEKRIAPVRT